MYRSRYSGLTYAAKFDNILHSIQKEKVEEIREKMEKLIEVNMGLQTSFFSSAFLPRPAESSSEGRRRSLARGKKRLIRLQVHPYRYRLTGLITPVRKYLQGSSCRRWFLRPFRRTAGQPLRSVPRGVSWQV
jgi:hypothetical protein